MLKTLVLALTLSAFASVTFAQAASAAKPAASSTVKAKWKKLKARHPASAAVNPEATPDKKGGN